MEEIYFISGHTDLSQEDFDKYYVPQINKALENKCRFIIGDAKGVDMMAQNYLDYLSITNLDEELHTRVGIFHMGLYPRYDCGGGFKKFGGFKTDQQRDEAMTSASTKDILYVRSEEESKKLYGKKYKPRVSGTEKNRLRRLEKS